MVRWYSSRQLHFLSDGKHRVAFPPGLPLTLLCYNFSASNHLTPSYHDYLEITYIFKGSGILHVENRSRGVKERDVLLVGNGVMHRLEAIPGQPLKVVCIYFMPGLVCFEKDLNWESRYLGLFVQPTSGREERSSIYADRGGRVFNIIRSIEDELDLKSNHYEEAVQVHLLRALLIMLRSSSGRMPPVCRSHCEGRDRIRRLEPVFSYVQDRYHEHMSNAQMAHVAHMSPSYFCRFFRKKTGMTPTDYIHRVRIDRAKELLIQTDMPVTEVAFAVGFENHSYFDSVFRRLTASTPSNLRRTLSGGQHGA